MSETSFVRLVKKLYWSSNEKAVGIIMRLLLHDPDSIYRKMAGVSLESIEVIKIMQSKPALC